MSYNWIDRQRILDLCAQAETVYTAGGAAYVAFECDDEDQARKLYAEMQHCHPEIPVRYHWPTQLVPGEPPAAVQLPLFDEV